MQQQSQEDSSKNNTEDLKRDTVSFSSVNTASFGGKACRSSPFQMQQLYKAGNPNGKMMNTVSFNSVIATWAKSDNPLRERMQKQSFIIKCWSGGAKPETVL
jgi:hypothetical protein